MKDERLPATPDRARRIRGWVMRILHLTMTLGFLLALYERQWLNAVIIVAILALMMAPRYVGRHLRVEIPAEFEMLAVVFVYASLFLGEVYGYYQRFWWWDIALHATSGLLLGIAGFLLIYVLNENEDVDVHMQPRFIAFFAFLFAVAMGALWEIFEFGMDQLFGMNMQKPMLGDPSGLTDTMWDLIVDTAGALVISVVGWAYLKRNAKSFIDIWIDKFIEKNPRLFGR
jgi:uncharacterized membrane protein YjdF